MSKTYLQQRGKMKTWSYRRRIPKHVQPVFGSSVLTLSMKTRDKGIATMRANAISKQFDRNVRLAEAGNPIESWAIELKHTTLTRTEMAHELLGKIGDIVLGKHDIPEYEVYYDDVISQLEGLGIQEERYDCEGNYNYSDISTQVRDAIALVKGKKVEENPTLSTALRSYINYKGKQDDAVFKKQPTYAINSFINQYGDMTLKQIRRVNAIGFRDNLLAAGNAPGTVNRRLNAIRAVITVVSDILEMNMANPFNRVSIEVPDKEHVPLDKSIWHSVLTEPKAHDYIHIMTLLLVNTGCRISEVAGLLVDDVYLDENIPYIKIQAHPHRRLKNKTSVRTIPLIGISLIAAQMIKAEAIKANSKFIFRQYNRTEQTNGNSASASIKKRFNVKSHSFRHELISRLRDAECPTDIQSLITGHAINSSSKHYGDKHQLTAKQKWLCKVALCIEKN